MREAVRGGESLNSRSRASIFTLYCASASLLLHPPINRQKYIYKYIYINYIYLSHIAVLFLYPCLVLFEQYGGEGEEGWARLGACRAPGNPPAPGPASPLFAVSIGKNTKKGKNPGMGKPGLAASLPRAMARWCFH